MTKLVFSSNKKMFSNNQSVLFLYPAIKTLSLNKEGSPHPSKEAAASLVEGHIVPIQAQ